MITFLEATGHHSAVAQLSRDPAWPPTRSIRYDEALAAEALPAGTYIFTDIDLLATSAKIEAARLYRRLAEGGCPVFNDPARVRTRYGLLRSLHRRGLNPNNVFRADEPLEAARFPLFIRIVDGHMMLPLSDVIVDSASLDRAIEAAVEMGVPLECILVVEYAAEPIRPGLFRKLSVFRIGDRFLPHPSVHDVTWHTKLGRRDSATPELYADELKMMRDNRYADRLRPHFEVSNINYGRIDFGEIGDGLCVYEINMNPLINIAASTHPSAARNETIGIWADSLREALWDVEKATPESGAEIDVSGSGLASLTSALSRFPDLNRGYDRLSREQARRGDHEAALESAEEAARREPEIPEIRLHLGTVLLSLNRGDDGVAAIKAGIALSPADIGIRSRAAKILARADQTTPALEIANSILEADTRSAGAHLLVADILRRMDDFDGAIAAAGRALALDDTLEKARTMIARVQRQQEKRRRKATD